MTHTRASANHFILEAFDREQWCPVLQSRFEVYDLAVLQRALGAQAEDDPELRHGYSLDEAELAEVVAAFGVRFDPAPIASSGLAISLYRMHSIQAVPYLVHTGYELPLLLDGRKKLARMHGLHPHVSFDGEERFDHWVAQGVLHRLEVLEPPTRGHDGYRTVYYTPKGEEWRIPAMQLIWHAAAKAGGWNEYFERLEGMLFGYDDSENDWWIDAGLCRGGIGGAPLCCAVTAAGLAWMESAGLRALPPCDQVALAIAMYDDHDPAKMHAFMLQEPDSAALVRFAIPLGRARDLLPHSSDSPGRWLLPSHRIPELNRHLRNAVAVAARRDDASRTDEPG
jgi:hypothetical protein